MRRTSTQSVRYSTVIFALAVAGYMLWGGEFPQRAERSAAPASPALAGAADNGEILRAFESRRSGVIVEGGGEVVAILPDDTRGSQHQRFIVAVGPGHTVLISHNIDLADRVAGLSRGDTVSFRGEYEWNERGGVVHWTHHDPQGRRSGGWIESAGRRYR